MKCDCHSRKTANDHPRRSSEAAGLKLETSWSGASRRRDPRTQAQTPGATQYQGSFGEERRRLTFKLPQGVQIEPGAIWSGRGAGKSEPVEVFLGHFGRNKRGCFSQR